MDRRYYRRALELSDGCQANCQPYPPAVLRFPLQTEQILCAAIPVCRAASFSDGNRLTRFPSLSNWRTGMSLEYRLLSPRVIQSRLAAALLSLFSSRWLTVSSPSGLGTNASATRRWTNICLAFPSLQRLTNRYPFRPFFLGERTRVPPRFKERTSPVSEIS